MLGKIVFLAQGKPHSQSTRDEGLYSQSKITGQIHTSPEKEGGTEDKQKRTPSVTQDPRAAGRKGGLIAQQSGRAHRLTQEERSRGGKNSHRKGKKSQDTANNGKEEKVK